MIGQGDQPILATLQFISEEYSLRASEGDGGINDKPVQYNAVSGIKVHDLRSAKLTYLENGISIINIDSKMSLEDFSKKEVIENVYLAEVENHLIKEFDAKSIFIFDWVLRDSSLRIPEQSPTPRKNPAIWSSRWVYCFAISQERGQHQTNKIEDYTSSQIADRVCSLFGEKAPTLLAGRYEVVKYAHLME